jgi:threonine dehydratase
MEIPDFDDVSAAQARIEPYVHRTPLLTSSYLDQLCGAELFFKCENLQKVGAFKARGAVNAVFGLSDAEAAKGVATHSSGNHAGALSYAAMRRGIEATVVMPHNAPAAKKAAVRPYDDARVIAGQATCALEMHEDAGKLDGVVAPIGGGGLISGTCLSLSQVAPETRIYAAEPANADDAYQSFNKGEIVEKDAQQSVADGLKTNLKPRTWHFVSNYVTDILLASESEILDAMYLTWERMKIIIEPSSAVPLAVILKNRELFRGQRIGVIITGGNVDLKNCPGCKS